MNIYVLEPKKVIEEYRVKEDLGDGRIGSRSALIIFTDREYTTVQFRTHRNPYDREDWEFLRTIANTIAAIEQSQIDHTCPQFKQEV